LKATTQGWGLLKASSIPLLGFAYLSGNFGHMYGLVGGVLLIGLAVLTFKHWGLPTTKSFISVFMLAVFASWALLVFLPKQIQGNPDFLGVALGTLYLLLWGGVRWFAGIRNPTPDEELRAMLDDPDNVTPSQRVQAARGGRRAQ
jgi:hypothetical protein